MNGKMVRYILGRMLGVEALLLLLPAFVGILYGEEKEALRERSFSDKPL